MVLADANGDNEINIADATHLQILLAEYEVVRGSEYDITAQLVIRHEQELSDTLTEQQNVILQKIKDNHTELMNLGERDAFRRGFSMSVRLLMEAMSNEKN